MLEREGVSLDEFCQRVNQVRNQSSMASAARLVVLTYYRLLEQINQPPFIDGDLERLHRAGMLRAPLPASPPVPLLSLAIRRFAQMKRANSLIRVWHLTTHRSNIIQAIRANSTSSSRTTRPGSSGPCRANAEYS